MNLKLILGLALVLSSGLFGCSTTAQQQAKTTTRTPNPPSAEQVRTWVGYPESVHFNLVTNCPNAEITKLGKLKWRCVYEYRKGRSFDGYGIAVFEPGTLIVGTNRANIDTFYKKIEEMIRQPLEKSGVITNEIAKNILSVMGVKTLPSGRKSYGFLAGFYPGRFSYHPDFDLMITEYGDSYSTYPPAEQLEPLPNPAESFFNLFKNVDDFLDSQP